MNKIPEGVTDRQALLVGDVLATGYWAARISEITEEDTVLIIGAGPTGICTLLSVMLKNPAKIIICEKTRHVFALLMSIIRRFLLFHRKTVKSLLRLIVSMVELMQSLKLPEQNRYLNWRGNVPDQMQS